MAVTVTATRNHGTETSRTIVTYDTLTLSGTYATGGFALNPFKIVAGPGTSPTPSATLLTFQAFSPTGYTYTMSGIGAAAVVKIFSAPGTELAAATAVPDTTLPVVFTYRKLA